MATTNLAKLNRLDDAIAILRDKLNGKLDERRALLDQMILDGETIRAEANDKLTLDQATNLMTTGRVFTPAQVREIRKAHKNGESQHSIGQRYGVSQPTIHRIVYGLSYRDVA
jgi:uncharacterized protein YerC